MDCVVHKLVADVAIFADGRVLLVKYRDTTNYDHQRGWFLPDDYLTHAEDPGDAAARIADEQAGIALAGVQLSEVESFGGDKATWHLIFHYRADLDRVAELRAGTNVAAAEWFPLTELPDARSVAHGGWAIEIIGRLRASSGGS
jgi:ADP-ribose pyrophosphatase YjhB (NUDIX family)